MALDDMARRVEVPTLLVRGALSDLVSPEGARHFLELCPHAEYVDVAGAAHMVAGDRNDIFGDAVIEFLDRQRHSGSLHPRSSLEDQ
jgi:non-heme chloroperoxidase